MGFQLTCFSSSRGPQSIFCFSSRFGIWLYSSLKVAQSFAQRSCRFFTLKKKPGRNFPLAEIWKWRAEIWRISVHPIQHELTLSQSRSPVGAAASWPCPHPWRGPSAAPQHPPGCLHSPSGGSEAGSCHHALCPVETVWGLTLVHRNTDQHNFSLCCLDFYVHYFEVLLCFHKTECINLDLNWLQKILDSIKWYCLSVNIFQDKSYLWPCRDFYI